MIVGFWLGQLLGIPPGCLSGLGVSHGARSGLWGSSPPRVDGKSAAMRILRVPCRSNAVWSRSDVPRWASRGLWDSNQVKTRGESSRLSVGNNSETGGGGWEGKEKAELKEIELNSHTNGPSRNQPALAQRMACFLGFVWPLALARLEESETYSRRRNTTGRRQEDGSKTREGLDGARLLCRCNKSWLLHAVHAPEPGNPFPSVQGAQEQESGGAAQSGTCASSIVERSERPEHSRQPPSCFGPAAR